MTLMQGAQYPFIEEYTVTHVRDPQAFGVYSLRGIRLAGQEQKQEETWTLLGWAILS